MRNCKILIGALGKGPSEDVGMFIFQTEEQQEAKKQSEWGEDPRSTRHDAIAMRWFRAPPF